MLVGSSDLLWDRVGGRQQTDGCALGGKVTATAASQGGRGPHPAPAREEGL